MKRSSILVLTFLALAMLLGPQESRATVPIQAWVPESLPLEIHFEYQLGDFVTEEQKQLVEKALNIVANYLKGFVRVKRPEDSGTLYLQQPCTMYMQWFEPVEKKECVGREIPPMCGSAATNPDFYGPSELCDQGRPNNCNTVGGGSGVSGVQYIIYVTATTTMGCSSGSVQYGEIASAIFCTKSPKDQRPTSGNVNICPAILDKVTGNGKEFYRLLDTLTHEIFHLIGFNPGNFPDFVDSSGNPIGEDKVVREENGVSSLITPNVLEQAKSHFGCDSISGVPLEASGGSGTADAHWSQDIFGPREVMLPTVGQERTVISRMTLAVLKDSGWYDIDYEKGEVGHFDFGGGMGCEVFQSCNAKQSVYYCNSEQKSKASVCSSDHYAVGACHTGALSNGQCSIVQPFSNMMCRDSAISEGDLGYNPSDWGQYFGQSSRCLPIAPEPKTWEVGVDSLSFYGLDLGGSAACFAMSCTEDGKKIKVFVGQESAECTEGGYIDASSLSSRLKQGRIGPCPPPSDICPSLGCKNDCSTHGDCFQGKCICYLGFHGDHCENEGVGPSSSASSASRPVLSNNANASEGGLDARSNISRQLSPDTPDALSEQNKSLPMKAIVISSLVGLGLVTGGIAAWLVWSKNSRGRFNRYRRHASSSQRSAEPSAVMQTTPSISHVAMGDLDGGNKGMKNMKLLYGNDIQLTPP